MITVSLQIYTAESSSERILNDGQYGRPIVTKFDCLLFLDHAIDLYWKMGLGFSLT